MNNASQLVMVFPITTEVFGLRADWFGTFGARFQGVAYLLVTVFLILYVGIGALQHFEHVDFEKKMWNLPILLLIITFWSALILALIDLVDACNTFLVNEIFKIPWHGFGFPSLQTLGNVALFPGEALARLLPNLAYWIVYAFFMIFFFFYAVIGPLSLTRGVLFDEIENFFELLKEIMNLLLWQTTLVVIVAFIMPEIVSGKPFPPNPPANFYFLSMVLGVLIFFVPALTRKFAIDVGGAIVPRGFRWGGAALALRYVSKLGTAALAGVGVPHEVLEAGHYVKRKLSTFEEFQHRFHMQHEIQELKSEIQSIEHEEHEGGPGGEGHSAEHGNEKGEHGGEKEDSFFDLSQRAKQELDEDENPEE